MNPMERADHAPEEFARHLEEQLDPTGDARRTTL